MKNFRPYQLLGNQLKELIIAGQYTVGSKLMSEREIATKFEVNRSLVREALIMLELEGLIEIKKGSGIYIKSIPTQHHDVVEENDYGPFEVLQARQVIESTIAACAAVYATKQDILEMKAILAFERENLAVTESSEECDYKFHTVIARASQNGMLLEILQNLWNTRVNSPMWNKLHEHIEDMSFRKKWLDDHEQILKALQKKDPELARKEMWTHLENVKQKLMELSDFDDPDFDGYLFETIPYNAIFETNNKEG